MKKSRFATNIGLYLGTQLMQDRALVTMEGEYETATKLSNGTTILLGWTTQKAKCSTIAFLHDITGNVYFLL